MRKAVLWFIGLATLGCAGPRVVDEINIRPHRVATQQLIGATPSLTLDDCGMFGGSRKGWCAVAGAGPDLQLFVQSLPTSPVGSSSEFREHTCVSKPEYGVPGSYGFLLKPSIQRLDVTNTGFPGNAHLRAVTFDATAGTLCLDFEYPYG